MVRELTTGALAAMAWLVVTAMLTLIAAFIARPSLSAVTANVGGRRSRGFETG
jgi:hypothetical protein